MNNDFKISKTIIKVILFIVFIVMIIVFLYFYLWFKVGINDLKRQHNKNIEIELENRDDNIRIFNEYINDVYGILSDTFKIEIKPDVVSTDTDFDIKTEFMDKPFRVFVDTDNKKIYSDNFTEVLSKDPKFHHLYSEWVKKQVGIDDENVELYFNRASCGSRNIGENIHIDFNNIISLDNLEEQICENAHNLYIRSNHYEQGVDVKINNIDNIKEVLNYADLIEKKIKPRVFIDTNHFMPSENNHLFIYLLSENTNEHLITIMYDYDENVKKYYYVSNNSDWIKYE